ncbi:MAG: HD domain-containing protein [Treponema sp.]|nr:HD domain-containing protein [Treponema sp.]
MSNSNNMLNPDDLGELEALDANEEFTPSFEEECAHRKLFSNYATTPYINSFFPVVLINSKMEILFANMAARNLFAKFFDIKDTYFMDVFGKSLGIEESHKIHSAIAEGENGYSWKGEVRIKSRNIVSAFMKVFIFPAEPNSIVPSGFVVMFDDITVENREQTRRIFVSLLEASKLKDKDTGNHIVRVNHYAVKLSEELFRSKNSRYNRIDADFIDNIGFFASMHDVGKIGTPDDILNKEGPLVEWEWALMREHTKNGAFILSSYPNPMAKEIALSHHERWDGSGYPYQLSGEMIPLTARIVAIADVYDALRMERSYKPALCHGMAVQKMREDKEGHFDPFLLETFLSVNGDFERIFEENREGVGA